MGILRAFVFKKLYTKDLYRKRIIREYLETHEVTKLHLGCGWHRLPGWLNTDVDFCSCRRGVVYLDAGAAFPISDSSIDFVFSEHMFKHLGYEQAVNMVRECHRVLKIGGTLRMATPDFQFLENLYLHPEETANKSYIEWSAGGGGNCPPIPATALHVINKFHTSWEHQIIYDRESITCLLEENGFQHVRFCEIGKSSILALNQIEGHFKCMPYEFYQLETMIVEADKC